MELREHFLAKTPRWAAGSSVNAQRPQAAEKRTERDKEKLRDQERNRIPNGKRGEKSGLNSENRYIRGDRSPMPEEMHRDKSHDLLLIPTNPLSAGEAD